MSETLSSAARYRELMASRAPVIVDLKAPSGFVFRFQKPNTFGVVIGGGELPQSASTEAVDEWKKEDIGIVDADAVSVKTKIDVARKIINIRDRVLELSYEPKLVQGQTKTDNELLVSEVSDEDLSYLFKWVAAGGDVSMMLAMFPQGREQRVMAGIDGKKLRRARKRTGKSK